MKTTTAQFALIALLMTLPLLGTACGDSETTTDPASSSDVSASGDDVTADDDASGEAAEGDATATTEADDTTATAEADDATATTEADDATATTEADDATATTEADDAGPSAADTNTPAEEDTAECTPACEGKACGDDGCGGSCGTCDEGEACTGEGTCASVCIPDCSAATCGDDGCGGSCGECGADETCTEGACVANCTPMCDGMSCGDDGCGGSCGSCSDDESCVDGECLAQGACTNAADLDVISNFDVAQASQDAAFACLQGFSVDLECATENIAEASGMTLECAACFGEQAVCVASNCAFQCLSPESQSCNDCRNENCTPLFKPCAGIEPLQ